MLALPALFPNATDTTVACLCCREEDGKDRVAKDMQDLVSRQEGKMTDTKLSAEQLEEVRMDGWPAWRQCI